MLRLMLVLAVVGKWNMKLISKQLGSLMTVLCLLLVIFSSGAAPADLTTDPVLEWNAIMVMTGGDPVNAANFFQQTRAAAMTQLAVFEAVNAIVGDYEPYLGTIIAPPGASPEAAVIAAAHHTLVSLYPASEASLNDTRAASLLAIPDGPAKDDGIAVGEAAAAGILAIRANDGSANANVPYTPGTEPGDWQPTPPGFADALFSGWGQVATFGIDNGAQFRPKPPPALRTGKYARDYKEVKAVGDVNSTVRPQDKADVARFYGFNLPLTVFNDVTEQVSTAQGKTLSENARILALLSMAITDGLISSMESKFYYNLWRPVTAIQAGDTDGNRKTKPDPDWLPLVVTPPYPSYPSNYASVAYAARAVLEEVYGKSRHSITLDSVSPSVDVTLHYTDFSQITDDINDARVFGGIHYRFDQDAGSRQGWQVGSYIVRHHLRPVHGDRE